MSALFPTITGAHWRAAFRRSQAEGNAVAARIHTFTAADRLADAGRIGDRRSHGQVASAHVGGGEPLSGCLPFNKANDRAGAGAKILPFTLPPDAA